MRKIIVAILFAYAVLFQHPVASQQNSAEEALSALMGVWQTGDTADLTNLFHRDAVYVDAPNDRILNGVSEIGDYVVHVHSWASDVRFQIDEVRASDTFASAEWTMTGKQDRPIPGRIPVATDRTFSIRGITAIDFAEGKITRAVDYIQVIPLVVQLGGWVTLPGGGVIGSPSDGHDN